MKGHVRKRGNRWCFVVELGQRPDGSRRQKWVSGFNTRAAAQVALTEALHSLHSGSYTEANHIKLRELVVTRWLPTMRSQVRPTTWSSYEAIMRLHVLPNLGNMRIQSIQTTDLNDLYTRLLSSGRTDGKGGLSPQSVRYTHVIVRHCLEDACAWGLLARNPANHAAVPPKSHPNHQTWDSEQVAEFLTVAESHPLYAAFVVSAMTGMRRGEVLGLRWRDVDLNERRLSIQQTLVTSGYTVLLSTPKTERSRRLIYVDQFTSSALGEHRAQQNRTKLELGWAGSETDLVFTKPDGGFVHPMSYSAAFSRLLRTAGLPTIRLHDLRHTWATLALSLGTHPKVVSDQLGHSSIAVTMDTYTHAIPQMQRQATESVAQLVVGRRSAG